MSQSSIAECADERDSAAFLRGFYGLPDDWLDAEVHSYAIRERASLEMERRAEIEAHRRQLVEAHPQLGVCLADVEPELIRWMWSCWLAAGKLHVFDGNPGMGKSTIIAALAASITAGIPWPDGGPVSDRARGSVVILTAEDDAATTIRPRMEAAGADVSRVRVISVVPTENGAGRLPTLPDDVELIVEACRACGAKLLVIDPVTAYLGAVNSHRDSDVRGALAPLAAAAEEAGVAVMLIRHLNKGVGGSALYRGGGSIAFTGLARVVWIVGSNPDSADCRALAVSKNNLAAFPNSLAYELVNAPPLNVGRVEWSGPISLSADDLVRPPVAARSTPAQDKAEAFLLEALLEGPRLARELYQAAEEAGISEKTLKRTKAKMNVEVERRGGPGGSGAWYWLPPSTGPRSKKVKGSTPDPLSPMAGSANSQISSGQSEKPKEVTPMAPLTEVAPLIAGGPLGETAQIDPWHGEDPLG